MVTYDDVKSLLTVALMLVLFCAALVWFWKVEVD